MTIYTYDGTYHGLLTVILESYERKLLPDRIEKTGAFQGALFGTCIHIVTQEEKALRVWKAIDKKLSVNAKHIPYRAFLSEMEGIEMKIFNYVKLVIDSKESIETDLRDDRVIEMVKIVQKVSKEAMRMMQFVRFQKTKDNIYFAPVEPDHDVLELVIDHFRDRFSDQSWLIYDMKRDFGIYYDTAEVQLVKINENKASRKTGKIDPDVLEEGEEIYQKLWKSYYKSTTTLQRKNLKRHLQYLPRRYWKYLTEK
ncbi:MAG: hypothetical protein A2W91_11080 [Bacteroidetes bacterium GWF2_38_335]|nr:MAG: hypothetical protein A2W91_11080 [Bacteroidetes bacterium GWF2_38_335]OFY81758.1 MAG: hypothetical protein A2281_05960 [Bacteroidetes bacterium RIFOXYA12_FULL_38_20]HBS87825.1 DNA metabolism protein [Bacteroidales bacterium]